ncbi:MAG TPA: gluconate 2-dehydrogenase subunit 3 family protein [Thermoanaerobaculia bacterium]|nr:gluconate 2-dehydrogenase subunit 3 family protein [Thermoanaerobaculia bacterium]
MPLTDAQRKTLAAAVERILPSDDGPGAAETGAAAYIERLLETDRLRSWQPIFEDGLEMLDGQLFAAGSPEERDEALRRLQSDPDRLRQAFFRQLVSLTLEAFLYDPARLGWSYLEAPEAREDFCLGMP